MAESNPRQMSTDRTMLWSVEPWKRYGFAVANFGDNLGTVNTPIYSLTDYIGQAQLFLMTHVDARRNQAPSRNVIERIGKLCNRVQTVLAGRQKKMNEKRLEGNHFTASMRPWNIHPVPFFGGEMVKNQWLAEYNTLIMIALTNAYQHTDNNLELTVTDSFAQDVYQYVAEIKLRLGTELLLLPRATVEARDFMFDETHYDAYDPNNVILNMESISRPGPIASMPTEDDLAPLFRGIPSVIIRTQLSQYPIGEGLTGWSGAPLTDVDSSAGTADDSAVVPGDTIVLPADV